MSLETLCVKTEAEQVCVKEEAEEECDNEERGAHVKEEVRCEHSAGLCELYAYHQVKDELVLGPVELHRPCVASTLPVSVGRAEQAQALGWACSVRLSRLPVEAARRSCRVGRRADTLPSTRELRDFADTYQCDQCGKLLTNKTVLRKHVHAHLSEPSRSFNRSTLPASLKAVPESRAPARSVRRGLRGLRRGGGTRLQCRRCHYECNRKSMLRRHQRIHIGEKPFKCSHFDYMSNWRTHLVYHERTHTGEKLFKCSHCNLKFTSKTNLQTHQMIHTGEKPFKCSHCDYMCRQKVDLVSHERIHTREKPFKCSNCEYKCSKKAYLVSHERIHTGEKPFKCSHCDYTCRQQIHLVTHERQHSGEKAF